MDLLVQFYLWQSQYKSSQSGPVPARGKSEDFEHELDEKLGKFQTGLPDAIRTGLARIFWSNSICNRMGKLRLCSSIPKELQTYALQAASLLRSVWIQKGPTMKNRPKLVEDEDKDL